MAEVTITSTAYTNLHLGAGIATGSPINVQNKTPAIIWLQNQTTQPDASSTAGFILQPFEARIVDGTVTNVWARGLNGGPVFVEVVT